MGRSLFSFVPFSRRQLMASVSPYNLNRFSQRLVWSAPQNAYSLRLEEKRRAGLDLLDLTGANPTEAFKDYPHGEIARAFGAIDNFRYEPQSFGGAEARKAVARWYSGQGIAVSAERVALTASTSEAYSVLFKLLCDPGEEVVIPCPSYPLFEYLAHGEAVKTVPYRLDYDGAWFIDLPSIKKAVSARTKAIVIVNPNNPTGSFLRFGEANELAALAERHDLALISDEVFMTYPAGEPQANQVRTMIGRDDVLSFSLNGLSKAAGMPQMKLGWIAVNGPQRAVASALAKLELLLDSYLSVSTPVQWALPELLLRIGANLHAKIAARVRQNRQVLSTLTNTPVAPLASEGGWSAILQVPNIWSEETWILKLLDEEQVVVQPGYFFDMAKEAFLVVSLITESADFAEGLERIKRLAAR